MDNVLNSDLISDACTVENLAVKYEEFIHNGRQSQTQGQAYRHVRLESTRTQTPTHLGTQTQNAGMHAV